MKKKAICAILAASLFMTMAVPITGQAEDVKEVKEGVYIIETSQETPSIKPRSNIAAETTEAFEPKTEEDRANLPEDERAIVDAIEQYLESQVNMNQRSLVVDSVENALVSFAFEFGFVRDNQIFAMIAGSGDEAVPYEQYEPWYNSLTNTSERTLQVYDEVTEKELLLYARYIDNSSSETVIIHNGYRSPQNSLLGQAKMFAEQGYNVLIPDVRSHNNSEGEYISFGYYEKDDLNKWIDQETALHENQEIILYGVSMGGATTMLSQETPNENVKAYIEDCGYYSLEQQLKDTLHLAIQYFEYIPMVNCMDWDKKEDELIQKLNEQQVKPILKFDLYSVSPLESVSQTGIPKLFIHGDADWFIPPAAKDLLYSNAIGYKEQMNVPGAEHGASFEVAGDAYKQKIISFLETVDAMETKIPVVIPDVNLLKNTGFESTPTNFIDWQTSSTFENSGFSDAPLVRNNSGEFVLKTDTKDEVVTAAKFNEGIRFYTLRGYNDGLAGQDVAVQKGEVYELSFKAKNETDAWITFPNVLYGVDDLKRDDQLRISVVQSKTLEYTANEDKNVKVKVGGKLGYYSILDTVKYSHTSINQLSFVNTDRTPPNAAAIYSVTSDDNQCLINGSGEPNTTIIIEDRDGNQIFEMPTDDNGNFSLTLSKDQGDLFHLMNKDIKGNTSESRLFIFQ
jgi:pimeloyl-ACP methyl ester carboxylesterase